VGSKLPPGGVLGVVPEGAFTHKILVPFGEPEPVTVTWIGQGNLALNEPVARIQKSDGAEREVTMVQRWPVRRPIPGQLFRRRFATRLYAEEPTDHRHTDRRHLFPHCQRRNRMYPGAVWRWKNGSPEHDCPLFERGRRRRGGLRRTCRRGRGDDHALPGDEGPAHGRNVDGPHDHHLQHVVHGRLQRGRPRSTWVLPWPSTIARWD